ENVGDLLRLTRRQSGGVIRFKEAPKLLALEASDHARECNPSNDGLQGADVVVATAQSGTLRPGRVPVDCPAGFERRVCHLSLQARAVKTENTRNAVLVGLHPAFRRTRVLNWRTGSAILKPLSV